MSTDATFTPDASRTALYSAEAEQSVLGSVLIAPDCFPALSAHLRAEDFYLVRHRWVWEACVWLLGDGQPIDTLTVSRRLEQRGQLEQLGGLAYLVQLVSAVPTSVNAEGYAALVQNDAIRRALLESASQIARLAYDQKRDLPDVLDSARAHLRAVELRGAAASNSLRSLSDYHDAVYSMFDDPESLAANSIPTGFTPLDKLLGGGVERKTSTIIAARPGMGKSAWLVQAADAIASAGKRVAFFSKEMTAEQIYRRMACRAVRVNWNDYKENQADDDTLRRVAAELERLRALGADGYLLIDDSASQTTAELRRQCERAADAYGGLDVVCADHLRLFADNAENETIRLGRIAWAFKQLAKDLGACSLVAVQLNNETERRSNKRPTLADVRGSGEIVENADNVIGLYRSAYYATLEAVESGEHIPGADDLTAEMWILKQRDGLSNACAEMVFIPDYMSFEAKAREPNAQKLRVNGKVRV